MMEHFGDQIVAVATAIIGVAIIAVIVSKNANTAQVISSASNAFAQAIGTAVSPVTGGGGFSTQPINNFNNFGGSLNYGGF